MNVVDSSGWLEFFGNGRNAAFFAQPLSVPDQLLVPSISMFEVFKRVLLQRDEASALQAAALMQQGQIVALDAALAISAAKLSAELKLPMADSVILATARHFKATLWTQDADFDGIQGVRYVMKAAAD